MVNSLAKGKFSIDEVGAAVRCGRAVLLHRYPVDMFATHPQSYGGTGKRSFTPQQIEMMQTLARNGVSFEQIAKVVGCSTTTLTRRFGELLRDAVIHAGSDVASALFTQATKAGSTPAAIFWLKARAGWKETMPAIDLSGATGVLVVPAERDPSAWITEQETANRARLAPGVNGKTPAAPERTLAQLLGDDE
jgi:AraC-like DNA-binding protein